MVGMGFSDTNGWPSGVTNSRVWDIGCSWREIHIGVDSYDWNRLDAVVNQMQSMGSKVTYVGVENDAFIFSSHFFAFSMLCRWWVQLHSGSRSIPRKLATRRGWDQAATQCHMT